MLLKMASAAPESPTAQTQITDWSTAPSALGKKQEMTALGVCCRLLGYIKGFCPSEAASRVLDLVLGSAAEGEQETEESSRGYQDAEGTGTCPDKERLRDLGLFSLAELTERGSSQC